MAKGAQAIARLSTIHLRGQLRTLPDDNFGFLSADLDFYPIELWKQFESGTQSGGSRSPGRSP